MHVVYAYGNSPVTSSASHWCSRVVLSSADSTEDLLAKGAVLPFGVQFLGQHFGDSLLVTEGRKTLGELDFCLGAVLFERATVRSGVHALDD
ncbi:hypothetical protein TNCV_1332171 [Trichonephila clavipes]|nr:hypothetical protein TNCV_1332171 [Trichonephila clavipes]